METVVYVHFGYVIMLLVLIFPYAYSLSIDLNPERCKSANIILAESNNKHFEANRYALNAILQSTFPASQKQPVLISWVL